MKLPAFLAICAAVLTLQVSARTFTNTAGKTIEAEILKATTKTVTLKLSSGKISKLKLSLLSEADRAHVKTWLADQLPDVRVTPSFVRSNRDKGSASDYWDDDDHLQTLKMSVEIENFDAAKSIEGGEFTYILVGRDMKTGNRYKILAVQRTDLDVLPSGSADLEFKPVRNSYTDGNSYKKGAKCIGYVLYAKRKSDGREIHASASTPVLERGIHTIITLKAGEITDDNFIKIPARGTSSEPAADVINVR